MHLLVVPFGSHGDVHPLLGLGLAMRDRGHRVEFISHEHFDPLVRQLGFENASYGENAPYLDLIRDPDLWHPRKAFGIVARGVVASLRPLYDQIKARAVSGETMLVGGTLALSCRLAQETLGIPTATVHLQPGILVSAYDTPVFPGLDTRRWPRWVKRPFFDWVFGSLIDPHLAPGLNALRAELGLPRVRHIMDRWIHSPQLVLGLFPEWFAAPQHDWPPQIRLTGFPLYDERDATPLPPELDSFLRNGTPPVAFTPGSANLHGSAFFEESVAACRLMGERGLLLTRHAEQIPASLPDSVVHCSFAPFSQLLPRVSALVHHGGIGTSAQAMAAGIPQLVMPLAHDQHDNAARLHRLGVARSLPPSRYRGPAISTALRELTGNSEVRKSCEQIAARCRADCGPRALQVAADSLESLFERAATSGLSARSKP